MRDKPPFLITAYQLNTNYDQIELFFSRMSSHE